MGKLVLFHADGSVRYFKLDRDRVTIGRRPDNDICLRYAPVSGEHAAVVTILADSFLEDLHSTNGTLVNGKPITRHFLRDRDEIDIGLQLLVYLVDDNARLDGWTRQYGRPDSLVPDEERDDPTVSVTQTFAPVAPAHDKRRSDGAAAPADAEAGVPEGPAAAAGPSSDTMAPPPESSGARPAPSALQLLALKVIRGANAGQTIPLNKPETLLGRPGTQVVALLRTPADTRIVAMEGARAPRVNGLPLVLEGQQLSVGDVIEIAGATLQLVIFREHPVGVGEPSGR